MTGLHIQLNEELFEQGKAQLADNMRDYFCKKRAWVLFKRNIEIIREVREFKRRRDFKDSQFKKIIAFLYLR